ncbi:MAG: hypothetical protein ACW99G_10340 [Candidatus Thorarchaeota archaeon]|jgi:hypothetical protein
MNNSGYLVVIEWDGMKPPTPFYHRVRALTSGVRQDDSEKAREIAPFARRSERNDKAVIMQEGAIYCMSKSLARALALLAQDYGATNVEMATVENMTQIEATTEDIEALSKINKVLGRRGRPPARINRRRSITCFEEIKTAIVETDKDVINCPSCGSLTVEIELAGKFEEDYHMFYWHTMDNVSLFERWLTSRISSGKLKFMEGEYDYEEDDDITNFVHAPFSKNNSMFSVVYARKTLESDGEVSRQAQDDVIHMRDAQKQAIFKVMSQSDLDFLDKFYEYPEIIVQILDAIFVSLYTLSDEERLEGRLMALSAAMIRYPDIAKGYLLALNKDKVDFFDAAPIIDTKQMTEYFTHLHITSMPEEPEEQEESEDLKNTVPF